MCATGKCSLMLGVLAWVGIAAGTVNAQSDLPEDAPPLYQPTEHFYNALGTLVKAEWEVVPTRVVVGEPLRATLIIRGARNPQRLRKPDLMTIPAFAERFEIKALSEDHALPVGEEARFAYELRPRSESVREVPELPYAYVNLRAPEGQQIRMTYAKRVPITVSLPLPQAPPPPVPLDGPASFFALAPWQEETAPPGSLAWAGLVVIVPALVVGWVLAWRYTHPDGARLTRVRRDRLVARVLDALHRLPRQSEPARAAHQAMRQYLLARWHIPAEATGPHEVAQALQTQHVPPEVSRQVQAYLEACDAARFQDHPQLPTDLGKLGQQVILALEDHA